MGGHTTSASRVGEKLEKIVFDDETEWDLTSGLHLRNNDVSKSFYGSNNADILEAGDGGDIIYGKNGNDTLYAGAGQDTLRGDGGDDILLSPLKSWLLCMVAVCRLNFS